MILLNGCLIQPTIFPDKTSQVWKLPDHVFLPQVRTAIVEWNFDNESEFMHLAQLKQLIAASDNFTESTLVMDYLPYARQDKEISNTTTFALRTFASLLNALDFDEISCIDAHSPVAKKLIKNLRVYRPSYTQALVETKADMVCFPDAGALNKYSPVFKYMEQCHGEKIRDQQTGELKEYRLIGVPEDKNILIVDDICDGGATFIGLAELLRFHKAKEINLFVSHGLFSKGIEVLLKAGIKRIYTKEGEIT